jgi:hypothetical protein
MEFLKMGQRLIGSRTAGQHLSKLKRRNLLGRTVIDKCHGHGAFSQ